jgi:hypothetical protein
VVLEALLPSQYTLMVAKKKVAQHPQPKMLV